MEFGRCPFHTTSVDQWPLMFVELGGAWWGSVELRAQDLVGLSETWWNLVGLSGARWSSAQIRRWGSSVGLGGTWWNLVELGGNRRGSVELSRTQWKPMQFSKKWWDSVE